ncbi:hypothetical protein [Paludisphaera mucosa]|uniref:Uncharacterized protein n=1 Tax=Paludisphaera mucosa TaxID=3030827 RepID=A0ABT6FA27_9BACT|nr:hypothetical protein [Paludisphaera mucosa]MDG3004331.1 hypothetical protein [Paludisphaera mucosa]
MGNFYVNFSVKGADPRKVADALGRAGRRAIVTPVQSGFVVAYEKEADTQATRPIVEVGAMLSRELDRTVLAVLNHDDDVLFYWLFAEGELADSYNSDPDAFKEEEGTPPLGSGDAARLCGLLRAGADAAAVEAALRGNFVFATERHERLAELLNLPAWSVGFGYEYVDDGELEGEMDVEQLIHVGGDRPG